MDEKEKHSWICIHFIFDGNFSFEFFSLSRRDSSRIGNSSSILRFWLAF